MKKKALVFVFLMIIIFISMFLYFRVVDTKKNETDNISNANYDMDFFEDIIIKFGATNDKEGRLICTNQSMLLTGDFNEVTSLMPDIFYGWIIEETLSYGNSFEIELYEHPTYDLEGWFIPEDIYISKVKEHFNVTDRFLKKSSYYEKEYKGFWNNTDLLANDYVENTYIEIIDTSKSDTTYNILVVLDLGNEKTYKIINVTIFENDRIMFNSCETVEEKTHLE